MDRFTRRRLFDAAAEDYDAARPGYPEALFDAIEERAPARRPLRILEIGCGTGQATRVWARRGHEVLAVELGARMCELARRNLAAWPRIEIRNVAFEDAELPAGAFDVLFAASSFHWVDPERGNPRLAEVPAPDGILAVCWSFQGATLAGVQDLYAEHAPELAERRDSLSVEERVAVRRADLENCRWLRDVAQFHWRWARRYDAPAYRRLMGTYTDHLALEPATLRALQDAVARRIDELGGTIERVYDTVLFVARPKPAR